MSGFTYKLWDLTKHQNTYPNKNWTPTLCCVPNFVLLCYLYFFGLYSCPSTAIGHRRFFFSTIGIPAFGTFAAFGRINRNGWTSYFSRSCPIFTGRTAPWTARYLHHTQHLPHIKLLFFINFPRLYNIPKRIASKSFVGTAYAGGFYISGII